MFCCWFYVRYLFLILSLFIFFYFHFKLFYLVGLWIEKFWEKLVIRVKWNSWWYPDGHVCLLFFTFHSLVMFSFFFFSFFLLLLVCVTRVVFFSLLSEWYPIYSRGGTRRANFQPQVFTSIKGMWRSRESV